MLVNVRSAVTSLLFKVALREEGKCSPTLSVSLFPAYLVRALKFSLFKKKKRIHTKLFVYYIVISQLVCFQKSRNKAALDFLS